mmetsp:Transcript_5732/g.15313  ORF Transcript_5732/g.15313 Transcript_5732/m.15313 type:complete len:485 (-) Transcript_5732:374-1828(-)
MQPVGNITTFLRHLTTEQRATLYQSPWTCQAVFRSLPSLAKNYVLRMLMIEEPVPQDVVDAWIADVRQFGSFHKQALRSLLSLDVYLRGSEAGRSTYRLHPTFQKHLQWSLSTGGQMLQELPLYVLESAPTQDQLDSYAHEQWEALQMYILDSRYPGPDLPPDVPAQPVDFHSVLLSANLLVGSPDMRTITDTGFQFLMCDSHRQLWTFLGQYIRDAAAASHAEKKESAGEAIADLPSLMSFLMQLGFMHVGRPYALDSLNSMEAIVAGHMMQLGLLFPFEAQGSTYFSPTRLASSLCGGSSGGDAQSTANADIAGGHIIVESNFKVNAWTTSRVQRSLLSLFCRQEAVLPNFWVGSLTHDSVNAALGTGIKAEEIIEYLKAHAHPHVAMRKPILPENVADQVRLWQAEAERLKPDPAFFYDSFESRELYDATVAFAAKYGLLLWSNSETCALAAKEAGHERIREYIKAVKVAHSQGRPTPPPS